MRLEDCEQIWHGFGVFHRHLLLMMVFDCPLAFRHEKKGVHMRCFWHTCTCFCFQGESFFFCWLELVEFFRLYLGASLCIFFSSCHICFILLGYSCQREYILLFLVSNCLLIYVYEFFIDICLYCVLFEIKILFSLLVFFSTYAVMHFV